MAIEPLYILGFTLSIIFLTIALQLVFGSSKTRLPPGKSGWPLIGETLEYVYRPEQFIRDRMTKFSPDIFRTSVMGEKVVVLCGISANKFLFTNESKYFKFWMPPALESALSVQNIHADSSTSKIVNEELHKFLKIDTMTQLVSIMNSVVVDHLKLKWSPFDQVKVQPLAKEFTFALSCKLFLNCSNPVDVKEFTETFFLMHEKTMSKSVSLPFYRAKMAKMVIDKLVKLIKLRESEILLKNCEEGACHDVIGRVLLSARKKGLVLDYEEVAAKINSLLFASFYTISTTITFLLDHLARYPDVYAGVLKEQMEIAETKESDVLSWKDIQKMKYSWNVACETMRVRPPALGSYREALTDFTYAGYHIPKGWKVHWNVYTTHKDPRHFPEPEKFDPSRFEGNKLPPHAFMPFGGGPLMCGGKEYARIEILIFLHNFITKFKLSKVNPDEKIIFTPAPTPVDGLHIHIQPKNVY